MVRVPAWVQFALLPANAWGRFRRGKGSRLEAAEAASSPGVSAEGGLNLLLFAGWHRFARNAGAPLARRLPASAGFFMLHLCIKLLSIVCCT